MSHKNMSKEDDMDSKPGTSPGNEVRMKEAAKQATETAKLAAIANTLKEEREEASGRKDPNLPLTPGRVHY